MSVNDFLLDFAVASVFIMIGQFLRAKVGFIQRFFIPASMLAGFMGLVFRYVFPGFLPMSDSIGSYPGMLIMVIFAAVGINGFTMNKGGSKGDVARMSSYLSYKMVAQVIQYGLVPAFSILVISNLWPEINYGFGLLYQFFYDTFNFDGPSYLYSFLVALVMFAVFKKTGVEQYIDPDLTNRISGTCTDYLVFFGIASIDLGIIVKYAMPLLVLLLFGIFIVVITLLYFGPAMNKGSWFERALFVFGYSTGVFAIGFILLRIVDPENKSLTLNDTAFACIFTTFSELFTWSFGPMMLLNGQHWLFIGIQLAIMAVCIIVNLVMKWWWIKLPLTRPAVGEDEG